MAQTMERIKMHVVLAIPEEPQVEIRQTRFQRDSKFARFRSCVQDARSSHVKERAYER